MVHSWANNFKYFKHEDFQPIQTIPKFYEKLLPNPNWIIGLTEAKPLNENGKDSFSYLKQYVTELDQLLLNKLTLFQDQT